MVYISKLLHGGKPIRRYLRNGFTDSLRVYVRGGTGGNGLPKFGGVGGQGGNVVVVGKESITLDDVVRSNKSKRYLAGNGTCSSHNFILGPPGESVKLQVPVGVSVFTDEGKKLGEINKENEELIIAKGGPGGHPRNGFLGIKGQCYSVRLDLKLIADVGLVGFPNAGKSTLLKAISHAKPKIANYPFTTVRPNIGIVTYKDLRQISVADLPGLIEGAHVNRGMGHEFLKHVERTQLLLIMADINGFQLSHQYPHRSCLDTIVLLNKELELYNPELLNKPKLMVINKMDSISGFQKFFEIRDKILNLGDVFYEYPDEMKPEKPLIFDDVLAISAKEGINDINLVKEKIRHLLDVYAEAKKEKETEKSEFLSIRESLNEKGPKLV
ncbi:hypothetical protein RN001_007700 [Aquatica leii]|uniref:GTP-binding protein 10 n=1 Tax=Aquatica leii TaxID=1421715 RepID=A0AAN7SGX9_9COLE|nr:hypothetical protein RN001_007700 [Aquatica leii]